MPDPREQSDGPFLLELPRETFSGRCRHFDGIDWTDDAKRCRAGVLMSEVRREGYRYQYVAGSAAAVYTAPYALPCFKDSDPRDACSCAHISFPSAKEVDDEAARCRSHIERVVTCREAIMADAGGKKSVAGRIECSARGR